MTKSIKPSEVNEARARAIPDEVFDAFNDLIVRYFDGKSSTVKQNEALRAIKQRLPDLSNQQIFDLGYLDVEQHYRQAGWRVTYDKPGYCEDYEASFLFEMRGRRS